MRTKIEKFILYEDGVERELITRKGGSFDSSSEKIFLLVHDAQYMFEDIHVPGGLAETSWNVEGALEKLGISNYLVAGIACDWSFRVHELSPVPIRSDLLGSQEIIPKDRPIGGIEYIEAIKNKLIPYLEEKFSFNFMNAKTIMFGSSCAGVITTYTAKKYPNLFDSYLAFSNAFQCTYPAIFNLIESDNKIGRYYHDMGGSEDSGLISNATEYTQGYMRMEKWLIENNHEHMSVYDPNGKHDQKSWSERLPAALAWGLKIKGIYK